VRASASVRRCTIFVLGVVGGAPRLTALPLPLAAAAVSIEQAQQLTGATTPLPPCADAARTRAREENVRGLRAVQLDLTADFASVAAARSRCGCTGIACQAAAHAAAAEAATGWRHHHAHVQRVKNERGKQLQLLRRGVSPRAEAGASAPRARTPHPHAEATFYMRDTRQENEARQ
jgi:hypothetical protein